MSYFRHIISAIASISILFTSAAYAGKLAIVIDDFGYRPQTENQIIGMHPNISVAVLPNAPHAREMATKAHAAGHEVLIHLPMAPVSKQPLEKDTLFPNMSSGEIERIIREAVNNVPYAVGLNNHMGSAMTSSLFGMQKVMQVLDHYNLYFLDSMTIGNSQSTRAAEGTRVKVIKRKVFLDDSQAEADVRFQFNRAIEIARKQGSAIAIGHPHPTTVRVLRQMVNNLPPDIMLVRPGSLLNEPQTNSPAPAYTQPSASVRNLQTCKPERPLQPVYATEFFNVISDSIQQSNLVNYFRHQWQGWQKIAPK